MQAGIATQLITVGATLAGVVLTLIANAYLEGRRAREARELESVRLASEHAKWLRDERLKAYAGFSLAGEEVLQFLRSEMLALAGSSSASTRKATEARWSELRTALRKAYNQVALFGAEEVRGVALQVWRIARNGGNDFLRDLGSTPEAAAELRDAVSRQGNAGDRFLDACRASLQGE